MIHKTILAIVIALTISALPYPIIIPFLHKLKFGQQAREDGLQAHLKRQGTPTMGGLIILYSTIIISVFYIPSYPEIIPILFVAVGLGIIGFLDDYTKIVMKRSEGLKPMQKLVGQFIIADILAQYLLNSGKVGTSMLIPFTGRFGDGRFLSLGIFSISALFLIMPGVDNGVNFINRLDGLCTSVTTLVAMFPAIVAIGKDMGTSPTTGAMMGSLLGFLLLNVYPAKVFIGDTGSLALGGFVATSVYMIRMPLFTLIIGLIYLVEVLSVIAQVTYFKRTGEKRIFKMALIHRRFELCGWSETRVVAVFAVVTAILYMVVYFGLQSHVYGGKVN